MSEENKIIEEQEDELRRIKLKRHMWEDEASYRKLEKSNKQLKTLVVILSIIALLSGWILGSFIPLTNKTGSTLDMNLNLDSNKKIETIKDIMEKNWLFGKDIEGLDTRLETQALQGMTTNPEDPHTEYMSKEEVEEFMQGINRNFVGIGVQLISNEG